MTRESIAKVQQSREASMLESGRELAATAPTPNFKVRPCRSCRAGTVRPRLQGTVMVPTCDVCDEQWITAEVAAALDEAAERSSDFSLIVDRGFASHPAHDAFVHAMRNREYGWDALNDAWAWFSDGWEAAARCGS